MTDLARRKAFGRIAALALASSGVAHAQAWPAKPIRFVLPVTTGGTTDLLARLVGQVLSQNLGQSVVVDSKPGAAGSIAALEVARAPADGYTFLVATSSSHSVAPALSNQLKYNPVDDFTPIALLAEANNVLLAPPNIGVNNLQELLVQARQKPGFFNYASAGVGSFAHLTMEALATQAHVSFTHVPYKGVSSAITDLASGIVHLGVDSTPTAVPHVKEGRLRGLAVTGSTRSPLAPTIPTVAESGLPGFSVTSWFGLYGPRGLPPEVTRRMNEEVNKVLRSPDVAARLVSMGLDTRIGSPADFASAVARDTARWRTVVRDSKIKVD